MNRGVIGINVAIAFLILLGLGLDRWADYRRLEEAAFRETHNLVLVSGLRTSLLFKSISSQLNNISTLYSLADDGHDRLKARIDAAVSGMLREIPEVFAVIVINGDGHADRIEGSWLQNSTPLEIEVIVARLMEGLKDGHIGPVGRPVAVSGGRYFLPIFCPMPVHVGRGDGVIFAIVDPMKISEAYKSLRLEPLHDEKKGNVSVGLFDQDGILVARYPWRPQLIGRSYIATRIFREFISKSNEGSVRIRKTTYGDDILVSYALIEGTRYIQTSGIGANALFAPWRASLLRSVIAGLILLIVATGSVWLIARKVERRRNRSLLESQIQLAEAQRMAKLGSWSHNYTTGKFHRSEELLRIIECDEGSSDSPFETFLALCPPEDRAHLEKDYVDAMGMRSPNEIVDRKRVQRLLMPDGRIKWLDLRHRTEYGPDGRPISMSGAIQDITEQRQAEEALRESQAQLAEAQRMAKLGSWSFRYDTRKLHWTKETADIWGIPFENLDHQSYETLMPVCHPDDLAFVERRYAVMKAKHTPYEIVENPHTHRFLMPDGGVKWVDTRIRAEYGPDGALLILSGIMQDITQRKQIELAMEAVSSGLTALDGAAFYEAAVRKLGELTDADIAFITRVDAAHPNELRSLGIIEGGVIQENYRYSVAGRPCAEALKGDALIVPHSAALRFPADERLMEKSIEAYAGAPLLDSAGRPLGVIGVMARDPCKNELTVEHVLRIFTVSVAAMMERERNRQQYVDLFEFAPDGLLMVDGSGRIMHANRQAEQIFGWTRAEMEGECVEMLVPSEARDRHADLRQNFHSAPTWRRMAAGRRALLGQRKDGSVFPAEIDLAPVASDGGVMIAAAVRDISERRALEEQLAQSTKMEAIGKLTGGMAHDFNNYLGIIISNLDLLATHPIKDAAATRAIDAALRSALRGADLIQNLVAFARRQPLAPQLIDIRQLLKTAGSLLVGMLGEDILVSVSVAADLWPVRVDSTQLEASILNLSNNARDAMPAGGNLTISARNICLESGTGMSASEVALGDYVLIEVDDSGTGMTPEVVAHVFEPFFSTKAPGKGTGLGLSMVYGFIKQSGGYVQIYSEVGSGTTVRLFLPRAGETGRPGEGATRYRQDVLVGGTETILVVEDKAEMREALVAQLASLGYGVIEAENGAVALALLQHQSTPVDMLLTDVVMPGKPDGYELASLTRTRHPEIKVLLTSGFPGDGSRQKSQDCATWTLLRKPYRRDELAKSIRAAFDSALTVSPATERC